MSSENSWDVTDASGAVLASGGPSSGTIGNGCAIAGCTDAAASNYDPLATVDDGSCTYPCTLDEVTLTLYDSYGDGGGSITVDGTTHTLLSGSSNSWTTFRFIRLFRFCLWCTDSWSSENLWDVTDASGTVLVSGANNSALLGNTPGFDCAGNCLSETKLH